MMEEFARQDALIREFLHQTQSLTEERKISILCSFLGNNNLAVAVHLQQAQDGAPTPRYWDNEIISPTTDSVPTHVTVVLPNELATLVLWNLNITADHSKKSFNQNLFRNLCRAILIFENAGAKI